MLRHIVVEIAGRIFAAPGIVAPIDDGHFAFVADKDRPVIAAPRFVGGKRMEMDARIDRGAGFFQRGADVNFMLGRKDVDVDLLALGQQFRQTRPDRRDIFKRIGKADAFGPRPGEPGCFVARPFRGHAEAEGGRGIFDGINGIWRHGINGILGGECSGIQIGHKMG